jgi:hypothetical protein
MTSSLELFIFKKTKVKYNRKWKKSPIYFVFEVFEYLFLLHFFRFGFV